MSGFFFEFEPLRAAQLAWQFLSNHSKPLHHEVLLKMLYLADKTSLLETGSPITGDRFMATKDGLSLHRLRLVMREFVRFPEWRTSFMREGDFIHIVTNPGDSELSPYDVETVLDILHDHGGASYEAMVEVTRAMPEYTRIVAQVPCIADQESVGFHVDLDPSFVLEANGFTQEEIQGYRNQHLAIATFDAQIADRKYGRTLLKMG